MHQIVETSPSSLKFGTSGLRGLVTELNGTPAFAYTRAFAEMLKEDGSAAAAGGAVLVGRDLRDSSPSIAGLCCAALKESGLSPSIAGPFRRRRWPITGCASACPPSWSPEATSRRTATG
jgi:phosphomannomutase